MNERGRVIVIVSLLCFLAVRAAAISRPDDDLSKPAGNQLWNCATANVHTAVPVPEDYLKATSHYNVKDYGADGNGVADDTRAVQNALAAVNRTGGVLYFPAGTYLLNSATLAALKNSALDITADNVTILGAGRDATVLQVTGASSCAVFRANCVNDTQVQGLTIKQNGASNSAYLGYAIKCSNIGANEDYRGFHVENCRIENCRCAGWIYVDWRVSNLSLADVRIRDVIFQSYRGNMTGSGGQGVAADCIYLHDESASDDGHIEDFEVSECSADCRYIKRFLACYRSCWYGSVHDNRVFSSGVDKATNSVQSYAIMYYAGCKHINSFANRIINPWTCGFYAVSSEYLDFTDNYVSGQVDAADGTLVTGGIALGACNNVSINGGAMENCAIGIQVQPDALDSHVVVDGVSVRNCSAHGILVRESSSRANTGGVTISGCEMEDAHIQIMRGSGTTRLGDIAISNNTITRGHIRMHKNVSHGSIIGNRVLATNQTYGLYVASGSEAMTIEDNTLTGPGASVHGTYGMCLYLLRDPSVVAHNTITDFYYGICGTVSSLGNLVLDVTEPTGGCPGCR